MNKPHKATLVLAFDKLDTSLPTILEGCHKTPVVDSESIAAGSSSHVNKVALLAHLVIEPVALELWTKVHWRVDMAGDKPAMLDSMGGAKGTELLYMINFCLCVTV